MGNLADDTTITGSAGSYTAELSPDWAIWGPNGGYLAAVALRAAGAHSALPRPASLVCHYLGVARFEPVQLQVETLRGARRAESVRVRMTQGDQPVLEAMVWITADELSGLEHDAGSAPDVSRPAELRSIEDLLADEADTGDEPESEPMAFFDNFDERPIAWLSSEEWRSRPAGDPVHRSWLRLRPQATFEDPFVEAGRLAILTDTFMWPAAARGYDEGSLTVIAPSLDLQVSFHRLRADAEWLLVDASSPTASDGLVGGVARVWTEDGELAASGSQQMLCRPVPTR